MTRLCPAVLVAAPASGQGKTTVTAAWARLHTRAGRRVRAFKCGPDFLDPCWLALATGHPVHNLDLWMTGEDDIRARLHAAALEADLILIEGVMGLFDGDPSAADLAQRLGVPVLAVIDASAMAGTFGALVHGLRHYRPGLPWAGVVANRVASAGHAHMLETSLYGDGALSQPGAQAPSGWLGAMPRDAAFALSERHLGLVVPGEQQDSMARLDAAADALACTPLGQLSSADLQRWAVRFEAPPERTPPKLLAGCTVAVARDAACCFIYPANLDALRALGAELAFFSPLADDALPPCDALWLPGGYPELHAQALSRACACRASLAAHVAAAKPVWAECGGMLLLFDGLVLADGKRWPMWGLLPGEATVQARLAGLGPQGWSTTAGALRGHTFHYSSAATPLVPCAHTQPQRPHGKPEAIYQHGSVRASYFHAWFASHPEATAQLFRPLAAGVSVDAAERALPA